MSIRKEEINSLINNGKRKLSSKFKLLDEIALHNQKKVLDAFKQNKIALRHFSGSTGYGYGDEGRDALKKVFADVFGAEASTVSPNIVSGTHAISLGLYAILKRGDKALSISGTPYDTLYDVIFGDNMSLKQLGVSFDCINLRNGKFDYNKISHYLKKTQPDMIYIQRSRGYENREAISVFEIEKLVKFVRELGFSGCVFVDNCYGEFVEEKEPTEVGADVVCGSLIKNIGGGIAPTGGYVVGKQKYIDMVESRLTAPSISAEVSSYAFGYQYFFQGLFLAPHVVNQALKGSMLFGAVFSELGYQTIPKAYSMPFDITRSITMNCEKALVSFINSVQRVSPIDSFLTCEAWDMPGYQDKVIMAAGCFVQGSSIELSADAPIHSPYTAYIQGGLTFEHCVIALEEILKNL